MSKRGGHIWLTLREMRIAKMDKKISIAPCSGESTESDVIWFKYVPVRAYYQFENFLKAQASVGAENDVHFDIAQALEDCMEASANAPRPINMKSHLKKFLKYER